MTKLVKLKTPIRVDMDDGWTLRVNRVCPELVRVAETVAAGNPADLTEAWVDLTFCGPDGARQRRQIDLATHQPHDLICQFAAVQAGVSAAYARGYFERMNARALSGVLQALVERIRKRRPKAQAQVNESAWPFAG